jgi:flagellar capping protein FliD
MALDISSNPNAIAGLASGLDTKSIIETTIAAERKKLEPIEVRKEEKSLELDAWRQVEAYLETVKTSSEQLSKKALWEGKLVSSSNPDVVEAIATSGATPGKHTLVVDKLALNHQIASQNFVSKEDQIGRGEIFISVGEEQAEKIVIDETNDTIQGYVDAINALDSDVTANIIKTGNKEKPFQIVLTSKKTGQEGEIRLESNLKGEAENPSFDPYYTQPSRWKGIKKGEEQQPKPTGVGASTAIPELIGEFTGEDAIELTFTVVNTGVIGVSESLKIRWEDNTGRYGYLDLGSFEYTPGEPVFVVDGISLLMSDGEVIVNDTFTSKAKNQDSELYWWKSDEERTAKITQPSSWGRQATEGGPIITGKFEGEEDDTFKLTVVGSGQIGQADDLKIEYESENGVKGTAFIGKGYEPGTKLSLSKGLEITLNPGILSDGDFSTFEYQAESTQYYWWLDDADRREGGQVVDLTNWITPEVDEEDKVDSVSLEQKKPSVARISNADKQIVGIYDNYEPKVYTFTALGSGSIGVTRELQLRWEDNQGNSGLMEVGGDYYQAGVPIEFDSGLSLILGAGSIFETDSFSFRTFSPVIQPPQDAEIRLGATELGGGLLITNPTNSLDEVIDGVKLNLLSTDDKPVTISVRGDTEKALETIGQFVEAYNAMLAFFIEVSKYNPETGEAAPLQGDRNLPKIQNETNQIFINPISGLDNSQNMLINIGLKLSQEGLIQIDPEKLKNTITDDLTKVANLFRSHGECDNSGIAYLSSSKETDISGEKGYDIDIFAAASKGSYTTRQQQGFINIDDSNRGLYVTVNGRESEVIQLEPGSFTIEEIARDLQRKIINDKLLGKMKIAVTVEGGQLMIRSNITGSKSFVSLRAENSEASVDNPLMNGSIAYGTDVQGTVNGASMRGSGQILTGEDGTEYEGLKLYISLAENQIGEGVEGNLIFTKGVGTKVSEYINATLESERGALEIYTKNVKDQLENYEDELKILEERIGRKREKLTQKFAQLESKLGQLKSEQRYLSGEFARLG